MTVVSAIFRVASLHPRFLGVWVALVVVMSLSTGAVAKDTPRSREQITLQPVCSVRFSNRPCQITAHDGIGIRTAIFSGNSQNVESELTRSWVQVVI